MNKIRNYWSNKKGITLVWGAFFLILCLMFLGLAVDIAYMYVVKNQLQVAADSACLAGGKRLSGVASDTVQTNARNEAITYAGNNTAAGVPVVLASINGDNALSDSNDITVGHWDGTAYLAGSIPVDAIQVRPRRTSGSPLGPVRVFLGKLFNWSLMSASASATCTIPLMANGPFTLCDNACSAAYPAFDTTERILDTPDISGGSVIPSTQFVWTSLLIFPGSSSEINKRFLCERKTFADVCDKQIYVNTDADAFRNLASVFLDPSTPKTECPPIAGFTCPPGGTGWWVIVPIAPLTACGSDLVNTATPKVVIKYAFVRITRICPTGCASGGCPDRPALPNNCNDIPGCATTPNNRIVIDRFSCIPCEDIGDFLGTTVFLVK